MQRESLQLTVSDYLAPIKRRLWLILALVVVVTGVVVYHYSKQRTTYKATTKVYVGAQSEPGLGVGPTEPDAQQVADEATLLTSTEVAAVVARKIDFAGSAASLASSVTATPSQTTNFLTITARQPTSAAAARVANVFAQEFVAQNAASAVAANKRQIATLRKQLARLSTQNSPDAAGIRQQIEGLQLANSANLGSSKQIDIAQGGMASRESPLKYGALAAIGSLIGAILLVFALERLDPRLKSVREASMVYDNAVLATIVNDRHVDHFVDGKPALSERSREAFRDLRVALDLATATQGYKTILVTSAVAEEGKSTITRNLALALSEAGRSVVVVDADLRRPALPRSFGVEPSAGLVDVLSGAKRVEDVILTIGAVGSPGLYAKAVSANGDAPSALGFSSASEIRFVPAGTLPPNPLAVLESNEFRSVLRYLAASFDIVLIDSAPLAAVSDAMVLASRADAVVLVARSSTDSRTARHVAELIARVPDAHIAGVVVNAVTGSEASAYGKGYGYAYYGYGRTRSERVD